MCEAFAVCRCGEVLEGKSKAKPRGEQSTQHNLKADHKQFSSKHCQANQDQEIKIQICTRISRQPGSMLERNALLSNSAHV